MKKEFEKWLYSDKVDVDTKKILSLIKYDEKAIAERFAIPMSFGTAGLRSTMDVGISKMNVYTVGKASQGLASYVNSVNKNGSIAIAYDSRIKSELFAKTAAETFAANGIKVYIYKELMPTPMLSFAVRHLKCDAGVVVTASHNPSKYNGYKAYGADGTQLGPKEADFVLSIMQSVDMFTEVKTMDFDTAVNEGKIVYIGDDIIEEYLSCVEAQRVEKNTDLSDLKVVYTPLNGSGNKPVRAILKRIGIDKVSVVPEQEKPDGNFPTAPYPNPEIRQAFECALKLAETENPDILLATDPDCDRVGIAVKDNDDYKLFTGNDVGALLLNYMLERKKANGTLPKNPVAVKTIVSTELCQKIADDYGCTLINVLTGFKFIGEQISILADKGEEDRYILGFEESYGYLSGSYARDKDAVVASMLICEMTAYYKKQGLSLVDVLEGIYKKYGYYYATQKSFTSEGQSGLAKIKQIMETLRTNPPKEICGSKVIKIDDYGKSVSYDMVNNTEIKLTLPQSNVLCYFMKDGSSFIVRPSGTEPKIKSYLCSVGKTSEDAAKKLDSLVEEGTKLLGF